jgi:preprotein translocase subunit SecE
MNLTTAVIGMTVALAIFLGLIDAGLDKVISSLIGA